MMASQHVLLAEFAAVGNSLLLFIAGPDMPAPVIVELRCSLQELGRFAMETFGRGGPGHRARDLDRCAMDDVLSGLIEPVLPHLRDDTLLWLVPHDVLHYLPLHAARIGGAHLIDRHAVCYAPSASVMAYCHARRRPRGRRALVLGDSRLDLPYAREEAHTIADLFGVGARLGPDARRDALLAEAAREGEPIDVVHIACHGLFDSSDPLESGVLLAGGEPGATDTLTAREIFGLSLETDLLTLSACDTGVSERKPGDELIGLTRALLFAGASSVVVSLWAVDDLSTTLLFQHFYTEMYAPQSGPRVTKAEALRRAQCHVKSSTASEIVAWCDRYLERLSPDREPQRRVRIELARANAQIAAGDLREALRTYAAARTALPGIERPARDDLEARIDEASALTEFKAEAASTAIEYDNRPFEHPYYWAPFVLVGDWS